MLNIFDSHTHLNQESLFTNWKDHLSSFIQHGGKGLVNAGANFEYNTNGISIAKEAEQSFKDCWTKCSIGRHPCDIENIGLSVEESKKHLHQFFLEHSQYIVAIGECGIDLHYSPDNLEDQKKYFNAQCELAKDLNLPIMIHSREAFDETFEVLKHYPDLTVYIHCWGYGTKEIELLLKTFPKLFIGFCGNITYPKAENIRESIKILPLEKILIETDAPYLSPQGHRGEVNIPERVEIIGAFISDLLGIDQEILWNQVEQNFFKLYQK